MGTPSRKKGQPQWLSITPVWWQQSPSGWTGVIVTHPQPCRLLSINHSIHLLDHIFSSSQLLLLSTLPVIASGVTATLISHLTSKVPTYLLFEKEMMDDMTWQESDSPSGFGSAHRYMEIETCAPVKPSLFVLGERGFTSTIFSPGLNLPRSSRVLALLPLSHPLLRVRCWRRE